jgi:adenylate kinase
MNLILFGPPGAGKGTAAKKLVEKYNLKHISTGDIFRAHMDNKTEIGKIIQDRMDKGILIDDNLTCHILKDALQNETDNFLLDGFPRTLNQAVALDSILKIDHIIVLNVNEKILRQRIEKRKQTKPRSDDDKIDQRMDEYYTKTIHTLNHYRPPVLISIDANQDADTVFNIIVSKIDA